MADKEDKVEKRSFLVGRNPSVDRTCRPRPQRQVKLFDDIEDIEDSDEEYETESTNSVNSEGETTNPEGALIYLRMRPVDLQSAVYMIKENVLITGPPAETVSTSNNKNAMEKHFAFTGIFGADIEQQNVYVNCVRAKIEAEESFTLLTYGTSGSGKTFTLLGDVNNPGIVPRALEQIFKMYKEKIYPHPSLKMVNGVITVVNDSNIYPEMQLRKQLLTASAQFANELEPARAKINAEHNFNTTVTDDVSVLIWLSFVEIYNENVHDLLESLPTTAHQTMAPPCRKNLKIVGNDGKAFIKGLTSVYVKTSMEAWQLLRYGLQRVNYASTTINVNSSRSHCILLIDVLKFHRSGSYEMIAYKFCDLAGSERLQKTGNVGSRLKEAQRINTSLLVLGRCLDAANSNRKKSNDIIPYRESKLTMLLQSALLGKEKLTMIVNVMPIDKYHEENMNVLGFASIAKNIVFKQPVANQVKMRCSFFMDYSQNAANRDNDAMIDELKEMLEENMYLRTKLEEAKAQHEIELFQLERKIRNELTDTYEEMLAQRKKIFEDRLETELNNLKALYEAQIASLKRKHEWEIEDLREELEDLREDLEKTQNSEEPPAKRHTLNG